MPSKRVTISVPAGVARRMKRAAGGARSTSAWVSAAIERALDEDDLRRRFLELCDAIQTTADERSRADEALEGVLRRSRTRRGRTAA